MFRRRAKRTVDQTIPATIMKTPKISMQTPTRWMRLLTVGSKLSSVIWSIAFELTSCFAVKKIEALRSDGVQTLTDYSRHERPCRRDYVLIVVLGAVLTKEEASRE